MRRQRRVVSAPPGPRWTLYLAALRGGRRGLYVDERGRIAAASPAFRWALGLPLERVAEWSARRGFPLERSPTESP